MTLVVETLHKRKYYAKLSKCFFFQKHIEFCDHIIDDEKIRMNENKLKTIRNWSSLQTIHDVRSFLNFCFYYRRFIENFAMICDFLYDLIKKTENHKFKFVIMIFMTRNVFELIKNIMCFDKIFAQLDIFLSFIIETDVSNFEWETMLYQIKSNDIERSIVFENKTFSFAERNYFIYEREFLVIKKIFRKWRCYVENELTTVIRTNHVDLQYFKFIVNSSDRLTRWLIEFDEFNLDIKYKFDSKMIVSNIFNRRSDYRLRFLQVNLYTMTFDEIVIVYAKDETLSEKAQWNAELKKYQHQFKLNDENKFYHRNNSSDIWISYTKFWARVDFLNTIYKTYDHCFYETMFDIIRVRKWWFDIKKNIKHFVRHCFECQLTIKFRNVKRDVMHFNEIWSDRSQFFEKWNLNFIDSLSATIKDNR